MEFAMRYSQILNKVLQAFLITTSVAVTLAVNAVTWPNVPLGSTTSATPMTMLVAGKDHKLFYEAYNDASDIGGGPDGGPDGKLDVRFDPKITYYGLFDSALCYKYDETENIYMPTLVAGANGVCTATGANWSGNWMNYISTSRIDALRKVLYGGFREIDTATRTILRRAYIPQDAHSWAKEYTSVAVDGYSIRDYSPFEVPAIAGERIFFGSLTANGDTNCATLSTCSNLSPALRVYERVAGRRVWEWASTERPVLANTGFNSTAVRRTATNGDDFQVRVEVCTGTFLNGCKQYPNGKYKPVGLLHDYGENNSMLFGLMTGSYDKSMSGGRLRKIVSSFADEVDASTGIFKSKMSPPGQSPIVQSFDNLRIRDFNNGNGSKEYKGGWLVNAPMTEGGFPDWGNPIGETLYEATRYFAGKKVATTAFAGSQTTIDEQVGLPTAIWDDPYKDNAARKVASCSKANFLTISDANPSFDSDQLPGSYFNSMSSDLTGLNVSTRADTITAVESNITGLRFIGRSEGLDDKAPSAKMVNSLGSIRGLAPEEPTRQGSYYAASVAYHAKTTDLRTDLVGEQTVDNFVVALSSPLPKIEVKMPGDKLITLIPFGKSVSGFGISSGKTDFQPTNQIVDFYVEEIVNQTPNENTSINGGRYSATFRINFEDVEQGADHDMDVIARYVVQATSTGSLTVTVTPTYEAGSIQQNLGYVISGTNADGVYLVAQDEASTPGYYLNVPKDKKPGYCNAEPMPTDCKGLPALINGVPQTPNTFTFIPGSGTGATILKGPLWYAAKYGAFNDRNKSGTPDTQLEWDSDKDGVPDTYFLVQNPLKLKEALKKAFDGIIERRGSGSNVIANSTALSTNSFVYQGIFNSTNWSGDLEAYNVNSSGVDTNLKWKASEQVPAPAARNITFGRATPPTIGVLQTFAWANLNTAEKSLLDNDSKLLDFVRGVRTDEIQNATTANKGEFRSRAPNNVLGDIAHSSPFYVKDTDTVYVGANGGMLHAFNGTTGKEQFAHIPSPMLPKLKLLANPAYMDNHQYFVDGDIAVSSLAQTSSNFLVATMGRGAKGLFGLDVSTPTDFKTNQILWEHTDGVADADLGFMLGRPVIAKLASGVWAVIVGNGYNSTSSKAVLYVFNLATGALIRKIDTGVGGDNGMASPGVRLNAAGVAETVYAGDLKGNVWKFDISSSASTAWKIPTALGTSPFFAAKDSAGKAQPITAPIRFAVNTVAGDSNFGKLFVHFGTGSDFQAADPGNADVQSWYGVIDAGAAVPNRSGLMPRVMSVATTLSGLRVRSVSQSAVNDMLGKLGFVIDLPEGGERIVTASNYFQLAEPVLIASSLIPTVDLCEPGGRGYINAINPFTGARLTKGFFDVTGDGTFIDGDEVVSSVDLDIGKPSEAILIGNRLVVGGSKALIKSILINAGNIPKGRISWREIIRD
jgi:type IV pilus assembly protein PilY1